MGNSGTHRRAFAEKPNSPRPEQRGGLRQTVIAVALAAFYSVLVIGIALIVGSFLAEGVRTFVLARQAPPPLTLASAKPAASTAPNPDIATGPLDGSDGDAQAVSLPQDGAGQQSMERVTILLLGTDGRADEDGPPRTDTMMVVTLDPQHRTAGMISLPRDLWVPIPGYDITTKINTAYVIGEKRGYPGGGPQLAKDTVSSFIGHPVDYFVRVDFNGFVRFIDLIGGVDVYVPKTIHDEHYPTPDYGYQTFHLEAGQQHLDGETALKYVRTRNVDSDYGRAARQQQVIQAVLDKVLARDMIPELVVKAPQLLATMRASVNTDLPLARAVELAQYVRQNPIQDVRRLVLDNQYGQESYSDDGAWILLPDREKIRPALSSFFETNGETLPDIVTAASGSDIVTTIVSEVANPAPENQNLIQDPNQVRIEVLNGTGRPGVAAHIRDALEEQGWQVVSIGDADRSDYRRTLIVNYHVDQTLLESLSTALHLGGRLPALNGLIISDTVDMRIIVGQDFVKNVLEQ
ncbi:MAG: LytR family transcriptional regulator [Caldilineae bacterium]|nr:MAG: LytR family transcriptional regulator [Caldilineae bacterium]